MSPINEKYNLKEELLAADEYYKNRSTKSLLGKSMLGFPQYVNSMRSVMYSSHLAQYLVQTNPDLAGFFTGAEGLVGKYSSGYRKLEGVSTVYRKIVKFEGVVENPPIYTLFIYNQDKREFDVLTRKPGESLTENYGYEYKNEVMDSYEEGDVIGSGKVLYQSTSYDEYMNYSFGRDIPMIYSLDPFTTEDAATMTDVLATSLTAPKFDDPKININDNDYPLNIYGDESEYKIMPDIGEESSGILLSLRRKFNNQSLYDFKKEMLGRITETDTKFYVEGTVCDITVFCNNDDLPRNTFTNQICKYYDAQTRYYMEIKETCDAIMKSGSGYTDNVDYLYKRACEMVDVKKKWKSKDSVFSNIQLHIQTIRREGIKPGQKVTARMGNKSVIAKIVTEASMPYYYDQNGKKCHAQLKFNLLGIVNRTTAAPIYELATNFIGRKCQEQLHLMTTREEKIDLIFSVLNDFNPDEYRLMKESYDSMDEENRDIFVNYCEFVKIHFNQPPIEENGLEPIFYRLGRMIDKYDWIKEEATYVYKWGREIPCLQNSYISNMYIILLKQTSKRGFSARNTGAINSKGLPARSNKSKSHMDKESSTAIRFGEFENLNFLIGMAPEEVVLFNAYYRMSVEARADIAKALIRNKPVIDVDKKYISRVGEFLHVLLKSIGYELKFLDDDDDLREFDNDIVELFELEDGTSLLCTAYEKFIRDRRLSISKEILDEYGILPVDELNDMIDEVVKDRKYIIGDVDLTKPFFTNCIETPSKVHINTQTDEEIKRNLSRLPENPFAESDE